MLARNADMGRRAGTFIAFWAGNYAPVVPAILRGSRTPSARPSAQHSLKAFNGGLRNGDPGLVSTTVVTVRVLVQVLFHQHPFVIPSEPARGPITVTGDT